MKKGMCRYGHIPSLIICNAQLFLLFGIVSAVDVVVA